MIIDKPIDRHDFGGVWTELKLRALSEYMTIYNRALAQQPDPATPFVRWYIDAFAGSGRRTQNVERGGILEGTPSWIEQILLDGSARRALKLSPGFDHLVFIEQDPKRFAALEKLKNEYPDRSIHCIHGDANEQLARVFSGKAWSSRETAKRQRGIVFLDPYGMGVKWQTLKMLAETERVDVWYLFPLNAVVRQAARNFAATDESKRQSLTEIFGTEGWKDQLYKSQPAQPDLFGGSGDPVLSRDATPEEIEAYARQRLQELFRFVSKPIPMMMRSHRLFSLFCLSNNPSKRAIGLIEKIVRDVVSKYTMASHHKSVRPEADL